MAPMVEDHKQKEETMETAPLAEDHREKDGQAEAPIAEDAAHAFAPGPEPVDSSQTTSKKLKAAAKETPAKPGKKEKPEKKEKSEKKERPEKKERKDKNNKKEKDNKKPRSMADFL